MDQNTQHPGKILVRTCLGVKRDLPLIRPFVHHYRGLGVDEFLVTLSAEYEHEPNLQQATEILADLGIEPTGRWIGPYVDRVRGEHLCRMIESASESDWIITADMDEFQEYPEGLREVVAICERDNIASVHGVLIDRLTSDGTLPKALDPKQSLSAQFPVKANLQRLIARKRNVSEWYMVKVLLHKRPFTLSGGNHRLSPESEEICASQGLGRMDGYTVNHFKWFSDVLDKIKDLNKHNSGLPKQVFIEHYEANGRFDLDFVRCD